MNLAEQRHSVRRRRLLVSLDGFPLDVLWVRNTGHSSECPVFLLYCKGSSGGA